MARHPTDRCAGAGSLRDLLELRSTDDPIGGARSPRWRTIAYTTVVTVFGRLWTKGLAERDRAGRASAYTPAIFEASLSAERMAGARPEQPMRWRQIVAALRRRP